MIAGCHHQGDARLAQRGVHGGVECAPQAFQFGIAEERLRTLAGDHIAGADNDIRLQGNDMRDRRADAAVAEEQQNRDRGATGHRRQAGKA